MFASKYNLEPNSTFGGTATVYDYIIIGAGLAGLHCARRLLEEKPHLNVIILEKYNYIGGRVTTFRRTIPGVGPVKWENGAGRIHATHTMVRAYMKRYNLTWSPIDDDYYIQDRDGPSASKYIS